jgi:hypothetical protein
LSQRLGLRVPSDCHPPTRQTSLRGWSDVAQSRYPMGDASMAVLNSSLLYNSTHGFTPEHEASYYNPFCFVSDSFSSLNLTYLNDGRSSLISSLSSIFADAFYSPIPNVCLATAPNQPHSIYLHSASCPRDRNQRSRLRV